MGSRRFKGLPDKLKKYISGGEHKIRIDLVNTPGKPQQVLEQAGGRVAVKFDVYGEGRGPLKVITYTFTSEDGKDSFIFKPEKNAGKKYSYSRTVSVLPNMNYKVKAITSGEYQQRYLILT